MNNNGNDYDGLFDQIGELIYKIIEQCENDDKIIEFVGSFVIIDPGKECEVIADRMFAFGEKEGLKIAIDGIIEDIDKEKEDFINW